MDCKKVQQQAKARAKAAAYHEEMKKKLRDGQKLETPAAKIKRMYETASPTTNNNSSQQSNKSKKNKKNKRGTTNNSSNNIDLGAQNWQQLQQQHEIEDFLEIERMVEQETNSTELEKQQEESPTTSATFSLPQTVLYCEPPTSKPSTTVPSPVSDIPATRGISNQNSREEALQRQLDETCDLLEQAQQLLELERMEAVQGTKAALEALNVEWEQKLQAAKDNFDSEVISRDAAIQNLQREIEDLKREKDRVQDRLEETQGELERWKEEFHTVLKGTKRVLERHVDSYYDDYLFKLMLQLRQKTSECEQIEAERRVLETEVEYLTNKIDLLKVDNSHPPHPHPLLVASSNGSDTAAIETNTINTGANATDLIIGDNVQEAELAHAIKVLRQARQIKSVLANTIDDMTKELKEYSQIIQKSTTLMVHYHTTNDPSYVKDLDIKIAGDASMANCDTMRTFLINKLHASFRTMDDLETRLRDAKFHADNAAHAVYQQKNNSQGHDSNNNNSHSHHNNASSPLANYSRAGNTSSGHFSPNSNNDSSGGSGSTYTSYHLSSFTRRQSPSSSPLASTLPSFSSPIMLRSPTTAATASPPSSTPPLQMRARIPKGAFSIPQIK